ncbi:MAG: hypothetical protein FWG87_02355 [Defluviitaleaceae bacterium]|nr:hypothetical protein [Defluviitaleaceae bacterium]
MSKLRSKTTRNSTRKSAKKRPTKRTTKSPTTSRTKRKTKLTTKLVNFIKADKVTTCLIAVVLFCFIASHVFPDNMGDMAAAVASLEGRVEHALDLYHETIEAESGAAINSNQWWAPPKVRKDLYDSIESAQDLLHRYYNPPPTEHNLTIGRVVGSTGTGTVTVNGTVLAPDVPLVIESGASVRIIATPSSGHRFVRWVVVSGDITIPLITYADRTFVMPNNPVEIRAEFEVMPQFTVTVSRTGSGVVTRSHSVATEGTIVTVTATANTGNRFVGWETVSGNFNMPMPLVPSQAFVMPNHAVSFNAVFEPIQQLIKTSQTFNATTSNRPNLMVTQPNVQMSSAEAVFQASGLPANATITRIELTPNAASVAGATIILNSWSVTRVSPAHTETQQISGVSPVPRVFNQFNGTAPNGTYRVGFRATGQPWISSPYTGSIGYSSLQFVIHYEYWG